MSEIEQLLEKVNELTRRVDQLESSKGLSADRKREIENAGLSFICDIEAIAYLWGCSVESVKHGRSGTDKIKRLPGRRIRATKREVLAALNIQNKPAAIQAAEVRATAPVRNRRKSLIT